MIPVAKVWKILSGASERGIMAESVPDRKRENRWHPVIVAAVIGALGAIVGALINRSGCDAGDRTRQP